MRSRTAIRVVGIRGIAATIFVLAGPGAQHLPPQEHSPRYDVAEMVKLFPVRVLGKDGRPVTYLRKEDFALYEDGQRKTITEFEVYALTEDGLTIAPEHSPGMAAATSRSAAPP